ncbi:hypothetical protein JD844_007113 [Phrynosoma platyrhinos]|uniref:RING-type domain-containing protein n=1 Tax=Phrynosoma platyrhinos TaxID=52577 RepID=A0ABQ7T353_PHRPL|nr:hypothetical protein JD844_007113 [Phrynosoma platyrhinos]
MTWHPIPKPACAREARREEEEREEKEEERKRAWEAKAAQCSYTTAREGINQDLLQLSPSVTEQFIELLCQYDPDQVLETLQFLESYRLEETIQVVQKYQLHEAISYLLEKKGDIHGAFSIMLEFLQRKLLILTNEDEKSREVPSLKDIEDTLAKTISLCQRNSHKLNQQQREALWFPLLEAMMAPQRLSSSTMLCHYSECNFEEFDNASTEQYGSIHCITINLAENFTVYGRGKLGEIQGLVLGMLDSFNYEQTLLETTTNLLNHDLHWSLRNLKASVTRGLNPKQDYCCICLQQYKRRQETADQIIVFSCGHLYHSLCLMSKECGTESKGQIRWTCFKCNASHKGGKLSETSSELKKGTPVSLAQTNSETLLDPQQAQAFDQLCRLYRGTSRLALLTELSRDRGGEKHGLLHVSQGDSALNSVFQNETFQLHLTPPPPLLDD